MYLTHDLPEPEGDGTPSAPFALEPAELLTRTPCSQMVHDLRNFLTAIRMLIESLPDSLPRELSVQQRIASLEKGVTHAANICTQLQHALRGENDTLAEAVPLNLSTVVEEMHHLLEAMVPSSVQLHYELAHPILLIVADATQIRQVLYDLVTNASDALAATQGHITIRTRIADRKTQHVVLEVVDTGCGMDQHTLNNAFTASFTTKSHGQGLGLTSVRRIVTSCGGEVTIDSTRETGTTVRCVFPSSAHVNGKHSAQANGKHSAHVNGKQMSVQFNPADQPSARTQHITVLLVEDYQAVQSSIKWCLESSERGSFTVLACGNAKEALKLFRARADDLSVVVLDVNLPDGSGVELLSQMRQDAPSIPIIAVSGCSRHVLEMEFVGQQPDGILLKPFAGDELIACINEVVCCSAPPAPRTKNRRKSPLAKFLKSNEGRFDARAR